MKLLTHPATTALGLTLLYLFARVGKLLSSRHIALYHWSGSAAGLFFPCPITFGLLWFMLASSCWWRGRRADEARRSGRPRLVPLPWVVLQGVDDPLRPAMPHGSSMLACGLAVAVFLIVAAGWRASCAPGSQRVRNLAATAIGFVAIAAPVRPRPTILVWLAGTQFERALAASSGHRPSRRPQRRASSGSCSTSSPTGRYMSGVSRTRSSGLRPPRLASHALHPRRFRRAA